MSIRRLICAFAFALLPFAAVAHAKPPKHHAPPPLPPAKWAAVRAKVQAALPALDQQIAELTRRVADARRAGADVAIPDATLATAELFRTWIDADAKDPAWAALALDEVKNLRPLLGPAIAAATAAAADPAGHPVVKEPNVARAVVRDGGWYVGDQPVFLTGYMMAPQSELSRLRRMGANLAGATLVAARLADRDGHPGADAMQKATDYLHEGMRLGMYPSVMFHHAMPRWFVREHPEAVATTGHFIWYDISDADAVKLDASTIQHATEQFAKLRPGVMYDLWNEPGFTEISPRGLHDFQNDLQTKYGSIAKLNAAWGTSLAGFADATVAAASAPGARNDLYRWNERRMNAVFTAFHDAVKKSDPHGLTHVKVMNEGAFAIAPTRGNKPLRSRYDEGIDRDALAALCDLHGCDTRPILGDPDYAFHWTETAMCYDLQRSLDPAKPIFDSEWHQVCTVKFHRADQPAGAMRAALWLSQLHGMDGCEIWGWLRRGSAPAPQFFGDSLLTEPQLVDAYATESIRVHRHAPEIVAFQDAKPEVRILLSRTSATLDPQHLVALHNIYEALAWQGVATGFVTEPMLEGGRGAAKLLIVPEARNVPANVRKELEQLAERGTHVLLIGDGCLDRNEHDQPLGGPAITGATRVKRQPDAAALSRVLDDAGIDRPIRCTLPGGGAPVGVAFQSAAYYGRRIGYLLGLSKTPVTVQLTAGGKPAQWKSLLTGETHTGTITLNPFDVALVEFR